MRKSKLVLFSVFIITFLTGSFIGYESGVTTNAERISSMESEISKLQSWLNGNLSLLQSLEKENAQLQMWLEGNITYFKGEVEKLKSQLNLQILGVYFSPKGGCAEAVKYWIEHANSSIHILIYSFTLDSISDELIEAYNRGVEVKVVFEEQQITKYSEYQKLKAAGIEVRNDTNSNLMHNKIMIVDEAIVLTGSFNWSANAENRNDENLIVIKSVEVASLYEEEFRKVWNESI